MECPKLNVILPTTRKLSNIKKKSFFFFFEITSFPWHMFLSYPNKKVVHVGSHLGPVTGPVLLLVKYVCFVVNVLSLVIHVCLLL